MGACYRCKPRPNPTQPPLLSSCLSCPLTPPLPNLASFLDGHQLCDRGGNDNVLYMYVVLLSVCVCVYGCVCVCVSLCPCACTQV